MASISSLRNLVKKVPLWGWIVIVIFIILIWQHLSGWTVSRKLYNMALNQLREDKTAVIEKLESDKKERDTIIINLGNQVKDVQKKRVVAEAESQRLRGLNDEKDKEILKLKNERILIVVPTDPNALADEFRKRGLKPRVVLPTR